MSIVVVRENLQTHEKTEESVNLQTSTLELHYGEEFTFSYYLEVNENLIVTAMKPKKNAMFQIFVELYDGEPIDSSIDKITHYLGEHPDFIPLDI